MWGIILSKQAVVVCAMCSDKHTFDKCKTLLDIDFLQKHFIAYCFQWKRTHRQITTAVNQLQSATLQSDATDGQDTVLDDSDTATDDDNEQNFYEEGE